MDWKIFLSTYGLIFLAELGDKTQIATMNLAAKSDSTVSIFIGSSLALITVCLLGTILGKCISCWIPLEYVNKGAAIIFIGLGVLMLFNKI